MKISTIPPSAVRATMKTWLLEILAADSLNLSRSMPHVVPVFAGGQPMNLTPGEWQNLSPSGFWVGKPSGEIEPDPLIKLAVLAQIGVWARCINDTDFVDAWTRAYNREVIGGFQSFLDGLLISREPIRTLAISKTGTQPAVQYVEGEPFFRANGEEVVIPDDGTFMLIQGSEPEVRNA